MSLPSIGELLDEKYLIEAELGRGGMAVVYRARHRFTHRVVALKLLLPSIARDPSVVERFLREARAASALDHPAAVAVLDVGRCTHGYYLVMEHLEGESLRARLARGPLAEHEAVAILEPLLSAVGTAHARGIVHRDIKPDNVFLRRREDGSLTPKLLDFGISKLTREEALTLTGSILGTPEYLAPEQVMDSSRVGPATDVYQLGVLLFEMLTCVTPLARKTYEAQLTAILVEEPTPLRALRPDASPELERILAQAMRRDVASRTPSAQSLAEALGQWRAKSQVAAAPTMLAAPPTRVAEAVPTPVAAQPTQPTPAPAPPAAVAPDRPPVLRLVGIAWALGATLGVLAALGFFFAMWSTRREATALVERTATAPPLAGAPATPPLGASSPVEIAADAGPAPSGALPAPPETITPRRPRRAPTTEPDRSSEPDRPDPGPSAGRLSRDDF